MSKPVTFVKGEKVKTKTGTTMTVVHQARAGGSVLLDVGMPSGAYVTAYYAAETLTKARSSKAKTNQEPAK